MRDSDLELVRERERAEVLLHPLRQRILDAAREPVSAAEVGRRLELPRQKVNYHMGELAKAGFLRDAGERRRGNLMERRYVASARTFVLAPEVLGPVSAAPGPTPGDAFSAARLLGLAARVQSEVGRVMDAASGRGKRVATFSLDSELRFESAEQRAAFSRALQTTILDVIARHASPFCATGGGPGQGRPFRLVLGVHPVPREDDVTEDEARQDEASDDEAQEAHDE